MYTSKRTHAEDQDFKNLIGQLDQTLAVVNGQKDDFFRKLNSTQGIKHVILLYHNTEAIACGCIKSFGESTMEIKRMYVKPTYRGQGLAKTILKDLEKWALELGNKTTVLETSIELEAAMNLYKNAGYLPIEKYGAYVNVETSRCFSKQLLSENL